MNGSVYSIGWDVGGWNCDTIIRAGMPSSFWTPT